MHFLSCPVATILLVFKQYVCPVWMSQKRWVGLTSSIKLGTLCSFLY